MNSHGVMSYLVGICMCVAIATLQYGEAVYRKSSRKSLDSSGFNQKLQLSTSQGRRVNANIYSNARKTWKHENSDHFKLVKRQANAVRQALRLKPTPSPVQEKFFKAQIQQLPPSSRERLKDIYRNTGFTPEFQERLMQELVRPRSSPADELAPTEQSLQNRASRADPANLRRQSYTQSPFIVPGRANVDRRGKLMSNNFGDETIPSHSEGRPRSQHIVGSFSRVINSSNYSEKYQQIQIIDVSSNRPPSSGTIIDDAQNSKIHLHFSGDSRRMNTGQELANQSNRGQHIADTQPHDGHLYKQAQHTSQFDNPRLVGNGLRQQDGFTSGTQQQHTYLQPGPHNPISRPVLTDNIATNSLAARNVIPAGYNNIHQKPPSPLPANTHNAGISHAQHQHEPADLIRLQNLHAMHSHQSSYSPNKTSQSNGPQPATNNIDTANLNHLNHATQRVDPVIYYMTTPLVTMNPVLPLSNNVKIRPETESTNNLTQYHINDKTLKKQLSDLILESTTSTPSSVTQYLKSLTMLSGTKYPAHSTTTSPSTLTPPSPIVDFFNTKIIIPPHINSNPVMRAAFLQVLTNARNKANSVSKPLSITTPGYERYRVTTHTTDTPKKLDTLTSTTHVTTTSPTTYSTTSTPSPLYNTSVRLTPALYLTWSLPQGQVDKLRGSPLSTILSSINASRSDQQQNSQLIENFKTFLVDTLINDPYSYHFEHDVQPNVIYERMDKGPSILVKDMIGGFVKFESLTSHTLIKRSVVHEINTLSRKSFSSARSSLALTPKKRNIIWKMKDIEEKMFIKKNSDNLENSVLHSLRKRAATQTASTHPVLKFTWLLPSGTFPTVPVETIRHIMWKYQSRKDAIVKTSQDATMSSPNNLGLTNPQPNKGMNDHIQYLDKLIEAANALSKLQGQSVHLLTNALHPSVEGSLRTSLNKSSLEPYPLNTLQATPYVGTTELPVLTTHSILNTTEVHNLPLLMSEPISSTFSNTSLDLLQSDVTSYSEDKINNLFISVAPKFKILPPAILRSLIVHILQQFQASALLNTSDQPQSFKTSGLHDAIINASHQIIPSKPMNAELMTVKLEVTPLPNYQKDVETISPPANYKTSSQEMIIKPNFLIDDRISQQPEDTTTVPPFRVLTHPFSTMSIFTNKYLAMNLPYKILPNMETITHPATEPTRQSSSSPIQSSDHVVSTSATPDQVSDFMSYLTSLLRYNGYYLPARPERDKIATNRNTSISLEKPPRDLGYLEQSTTAMPQADHFHPSLIKKLVSLSAQAYETTTTESNAFSAAPIQSKYYPDPAGRKEFNPVVNSDVSSGRSLVDQNIAFLINTALNAILSQSSVNVLQTNNHGLLAQSVVSFLSEANIKSNHSTLDSSSGSTANINRVLNVNDWTTRRYGNDGIKTTLDVKGEIKSDDYYVTTISPLNFAYGQGDSLSVNGNNPQLRIYQHLAPNTGVEASEHGKQVTFGPTEGGKCPLGHRMSCRPTRPSQRLVTFCSQRCDEMTAVCATAICVCNCVDATAANIGRSPTEGPSISANLHHSVPVDSSGAGGLHSDGLLISNTDPELVTVITSTMSTTEVTTTDDRLRAFFRLMQKVSGGKQETTEEKEPVD